MSHMCVYWSTAQTEWQVQYALIFCHCLLKQPIKPVKHWHYGSQSCQNSEEDSHIHIAYTSIIMECKWSGNRVHRSQQPTENVWMFFITLLQQENLPHVWCIPLTSRIKCCCVFWACQHGFSAAILHEAQHALTPVTPTLNGSRCACYTPSKT